MPNPVDQARAAGYTDDEINTYLAPRVSQALQNGYSADEVNSYLGIKPPPEYDFAPLKKQITDNLDNPKRGGYASVAGVPLLNRQAAPAPPEGTPPKPVTSFDEALEAGLQISVSGLLARNRAPSKMLAEDAPMASRIANNVGSLAGDLPFMVGGFALGAGAGAESGPGAAVTGSAGAFALPAGLRSTLMDSYAKGSFKDFPDFWSRASGIFVDTAKAWLTGAATGAAGQAVKAVIPPTVSSGVASTAQTAAEVATMTTVGKALEGKVPSAQDFIDAAVVVGGLKFAEAGAAKLRSIYAETGLTPTDVAQDAARDPTIAQDLMSQKTDIPSAYADKMPKEAPSPDSVIDLQRSQLDQLANEQKLSDHEKLVRALGSEDKAQDFNRLQRRMNSSDPGRADAASKEFDAKFGDLSPDQERLIYGTGEPGLSPEELKAVQGAHSDVTFGPNDADTSVAYVLTIGARKLTPEKIAEVQAGGGTGADQANFIRVREAFAELKRRGLSNPEIDREVIAAFEQAGWPRDAALGVMDGFAGRKPAGRAALSDFSATKDGEISIDAEPITPEAKAPISDKNAQAKILDRLSIGEKPIGRGWSFSRIYTNFVDKLFPIEEATSKAGGEDLAAADNPYKLARLMSGVAGKADHMLNYGTFDFNTYENNGPSLRSILEPVANDLDGFRAFAASLRAVELNGRGIETGMDIDAARQVARAGAEKYAEPIAGLLNYQNKVTAYLRDSGVISREGYAAMREQNKAYVPFYRVMDSEGESGVKISGGSLQPSDPIKGIEGSTRRVIDPIESVIRNTMLFTQMAEKNAVATKLVDMLKTAPEPDATETSPIAKDEIRVFHNGQAQTYQVDPELARAVKGLDQSTMGDIERMLAPFARTLRAGAVLQPDFVMRHTIRDYLYGAVTYPNGFFSPVDMARGFLGLAKKDPDYQNWLKSGGANVSMVALDRQYLQNSIDDLADTGILERAWNVVGDPDESLGAKAKAVGTMPIETARKFLVDPMRAAVSFAESASHLGAFKKSIADIEEPTKADIQESGFISRDVAVDASRMGAKMRAWNAISAFSNITIQDTDRVIRAFAENPASTAVKVAAAISVPSALVWWAGHDDSRYRDAPNWEKDLFWVIPTDKWENATQDQATGLPPDLVRSVDGKLQINNGITWRIPKPWGMGLVFGSGVERVLDAYHDHNPEAFKGLLKSFAQVSIPAIIPTAAVPIVEQFANRSIFMDRTLIPSELEKQLPEYQYTNYTTELAKALGKIIGGFPGIQDAKIGNSPMGGTARALSSPIMIENYIRAWTGNLGSYTLELADKGLRTVGVLPDPVAPASTLADIPFIKAFVMRYPSASVQSIQDFTDSYDRNKVYFDTFLARAREGDFEATARVQGAGGPMMFVQLDGIRKVIAEHSKLIRDVYKNPDIEPDQKRQLIDQMYYREIEMAHIGNEAFKRAQEAMARAPAQMIAPPSVVNAPANQNSGALPRVAQ